MNKKIFKIWVIYILFILFIFYIDISCSTKKDENLCPRYLIDTTSYQCHNPKAKNFSFLSKYKNIKILDLTGTYVESLSFLNSLKKIEILIVDSSTINQENIKKELLGYKNLKIINSDKSLPDIIKQYLDFSFSFIKKDIEDLNYFLIPFYSKNRLYLNKNEIISFQVYDNIKSVSYVLYEHEFNDIKGITQLYNLKKLKIVLKSDKYIEYITKLKYLEELSLIGKIGHLPIFQKSLTSLYLYNINIKDFSFLKKSNISYLYITTKDYKNNYWNKLKKEYPNIEIEIKNNFFIPTKPLYHPCHNQSSYNFGKSYIRFYHFFLKIEKEILEELRDNNLMISLTLQNIKFMINKVGIKINHLWNKDITFLDRALGNNQKEVIKYLKKNNAKRGCEILNKKCEKPIKTKIKEYYPKCKPLNTE